jgi:glycosyltransferase involved in cell wall biosynthesis
MRVTFDLTFGGPAIVPAPDERVVTLGELAAMVRAPRELRRLLRAERLEQVRAVRDGRPLNGVAAGGLMLASLSRARRFEVSSPSSTIRPNALLMRAQALATLAYALPLELARSVAFYRRARRASARGYSLPRAPDVEPRRVTYLRAEPSLRWLGSQVGGAATHTAGVINALAARGVEVTVFAPEEPDGVRGARCVAVSARHVLQLVHWLTLAGHSRELVTAAREVPADLVYQRYALGSYAGLELARQLGVPLVLEFNGSEIWTERNWGSGRVPLVKTLSALERRNLTDASLIVVVSGALKDQLVSEGIDPARVLAVPNGVDVDELAGAREDPPARWRDRLGLAEAPTVGFVGTFGLWHGVKLLPELIELVTGERADARWILIGDGPLHAEVAEEIERRGLADLVTLPGIVPQRHAIELLASCEVCVSPHVPNPDGTPFFGSPTKLFQYMGLGRAIVASDLDQIGEVLEHERSALLAEPGDVAAAASCVVRLLGDAKLRERLGQSALGDAVTRYSWDAHVRCILETLKAARTDGAVPASSAAAKR